MREMIKLTMPGTMNQVEGPVYVQPQAVVAVKPIKNGCKITLAFSGDIYVNEGLDTIKHKLENGDDPQ